jgi:hypothetical protein
MAGSIRPTMIGGEYAQVLRVHALERTPEGVDAATAFVAAAHVLAAESAPVFLGLRSPAVAAADAQLPATYSVHRWLGEDSAPPAAAVQRPAGLVETRLPARVGAGSLYDGWSPR